MTITPGPTTASSVFSLADSDLRVPASSVEIDPKAALMSTPCAVSIAAARPLVTRLGLVEVMAEHPFRGWQASGIGGTRKAPLRAAQMTGYVRPGRWGLARDLQGGACACPVRAESPARGAGHGPVYRVPRLAPLQPGARPTAPLISGTGSPATPSPPPGRPRAPASRGWHLSR